MSLFRRVDPKQNFPKLEERILEFWKEQHIFEKALAETVNDPRPVFSFYEGPPTANGQPGIHHVLTRAFKDVIPRYKSMQGFRVPRKAGWDCHGLPVEVEVEKSLGLKGKSNIESYGVAEFNAKCKESVLKYIKHWDQLTERIGYWVDTKNAYRTLDNDYIESCWSLLQYFWDHDLLKQDYKITKHCPRCGTSLAEAEASQGMKENVEDPAVTVKLTLLPGQTLPFEKASKDETPTSLLIWTTTPFTLPANVAAAVHQDAVYALCEKIEQGPKQTSHVHRYILLASQVEKVLGSNDCVLSTAKGSALVGLRYQPLYPAASFSGQLVPKSEQSSAYVVIADETVQDNEGTGIVHIAPAYGDLDIGRRHQLPIFFSVGLDGMVFSVFSSFAGTFFKDADPLIIRDLKERALLLKNERVHHSYPFCWRCDTPLLYFAKTSWYIKTTAKKEEMIQINDQINWIPSHIKEGRFGDWLRNNIDWAISRERYFGTPLPLWECKACHHRILVGSIKELTQFVGRDVTKDEGYDLHRPYVDSLSWNCLQSPCPGRMHRIKDVVDCWFDSGAMPYAQHHYPFENKQKFLESFPADFICEAVDQTRGWFYTLHALAVLRMGSKAYKNCIVLGHILDEQGRKMSKRLGNIVDPWIVLHAEGADALRYYLYTASPPGQPRRFSQNLVRQGLRQFLLTFWNCYSFFATYAEVEFDKLGKESIPWQNRPIIDQWALGQLHRLIAKTTERLEEYDITSAVRGISDFIDELSNWYVRRNRDRFWLHLDEVDGKIGSDKEQSKRAAYQTLHECLATSAQLLAPFLPFVSEEIWQNLVRTLDPTAKESVHLSSWPKFDKNIIQETQSLVKEMQDVLTIVNLGRAARVECGIKIRQPLQAVKIQTSQHGQAETLQRFVREMKEELNVEEVEWVHPDLPLVKYTLRPNLPKLGKKYGPALQEIKQALQQASEETVRLWAQLILQEQSIIIKDSGITLSADEVLLSAESIPGFAAQAKDGLVVALSTQITPELKERGIAREIIRAVGELRKQAGCHVNDRVFIGIESTDVESIASIENQAIFIQQETLSSLQTQPLLVFDVKSDVDLDGIKIEVTLSKTGPN